MLADKAIIEACNAIHQYGAMGAATPSQFAGVEAISEASDKIRKTAVKYMLLGQSMS